MTARLDISFEFFPPAAGPAEPGFWAPLDRLAPLEPAFISLTYGAGGTTRERSDRILRAPRAARARVAGRAPDRRRIGLLAVPAPRRRAYPADHGWR